jgi:hypothetical protein
VASPAWRALPGTNRLQAHSPIDAKMRSWPITYCQTYGWCSSIWSTVNVGRAPMLRIRRLANSYWYATAAVPDGNEAKTWCCWSADTAAWIWDWASPVEASVSTITILRP